MYIAVLMNLISLALILVLSFAFMFSSQCHMKLSVKLGYCKFLFLLCLWTSYSLKIVMIRFVTFKNGEIYLLYFSYFRMTLSFQGN
jgi:hypothetical protein